jgi:hypothetical protein
MHANNACSPMNQISQPELHRLSRQYVRLYELPD